MLLGSGFRSPVLGRITLRLRRSPRQWRFRVLVLLFCWLSLTPLATMGDGNRSRVSLLKVGTVDEGADVIRTRGLAARKGVELKVHLPASVNAIHSALQRGAGNIIVNDWIWVSRQYEVGHVT